MDFYARTPSPLGQILLVANGRALTGLYFMGQKDCPSVDGLSGPPPAVRNPASGVMDGKPISRFRAYKKPLAASGDSSQLALDIGVVDAGRVSAGSSAATGTLALMREDTPASLRALFKQVQTELYDYFGGRRERFSIALEPVGTEFQQRVWCALRAIPYGQVVSYGQVACAVGLSARHARPVGTAVGRNPITILIPCHRVVSGSGLLTGYTGGLERKVALLGIEGFTLQ